MEALKRFLKSSTCKELVRVLVALLAGYAGSGCSVFGGASHPAMDVIACKVAVLEPYIGDAAAAVVRDIDGNRAFNPIEYFLANGMSVDEVLKTRAEYMACEPASAPAPAPEQG